MIIVSGCPRSGTSLMMDCLRQALGDDRIIGKAFPFEDRINQRAETEIEKYIKKKYGIRTKDQEAVEKSKDMNPNGFWECRYTVQGVKWHRGIDRVCKPEMVCKIVSQGLAHSDPKYIDRIIYMMRHPREVAKSQERLRSNLPGAEELKEKAGPVHSPKMFVDVTCAAARWLLENPKPIQLVHYDSLIEYPEETLGAVKGFLGEGDFSKHPIDRGLKRSAREDIDNELWEDAEHIYDRFIAGDYQNLVEYIENPKSRTNKVGARYPCVRLDEMVVYKHCENCYNDKMTMWNLRKKAEERKIDWRNEPCVFECGIGIDVDTKAVEQSIQFNHWEDGTEESRGLGDTISKAVEKTTGIKTKNCRGCNSRRNLLNRLIPYLKGGGNRGG